jgi:Na+-translocating ferredoxin:NAD+ oxidoreductase RnfG subunit
LSRSHTIVLALLALFLWDSSRAQDEQIPTEEEIGSVEVLSSDDAALAEIFPSADSAQSRSIVVDSTMRAALRSRLGWIVRDSAMAYFDVFADGRRLGVAVVADEQGKYRPITFMAGVDTALRIVDVRVLVYRESRGGEVRHTRFLKQYRGKSLENPLRINRDIVNITGATISVNALNAGVRKALAVVEYLYPVGGAR